MLIMAQIKALLDEYGIIYEAVKSLPDDKHKIQLLEALAELEDNSCHSSRSFPKTRLHRVTGYKKVIYRADINKISGWRIHLQYNKETGFLVLFQCSADPRMTHHSFASYPSPSHPLHSFFFIYQSSLLPLPPSTPAFKFKPTLFFFFCLFFFFFFLLFLLSFRVFFFFLFFLVFLFWLFTLLFKDHFLKFWR